MKHEDVLVPRVVRKGNLGIGTVGEKLTLLGGTASWPHGCQALGASGTRLSEMEEEGVGVYFAQGR